MDLLTSLTPFSQNNDHTIFHWKINENVKKKATKRKIEERKSKQGNEKN